MHIAFAPAPAEEHVHVIATPVFKGGELSEAAEAIDGASDGLIKRALASSRFTGRAGEVMVFPAPAGVGADRVALVGVGEADALGPEVFERVGASVVRAVLTSGAEHVEVRLGSLGDGEAAARWAFGGLLATYRFDAYRTKLPDEAKPSLTHLTVVSDAAADADSAWPRYAAVSQGVSIARDLVSEPPNVLHPPAFAERIRALADTGLEIEVLGESDMEALGMNTLLAVGRGSVRESQMAIMRWNGGAQGEAPIAFLGKGVTFDTGGISLKPPPGMEDMKGDMGGAAAVTGLMAALAARKAKVNAIGLVGLVENMPDGAAQRPGDIVTTLSGQTVEVLNTDAEGRLVLADVLWYCQDRFEPKFMIDLATLTGAMLISLAQEYAGLFASDDVVADQLLAAGLASGEKLWRMPLGQAYDDMLKSPVADMKNIGGRDGGSITAAQFLKRFTNDVPWAHLDIAPTAWKSKNDDPREPTWATGFGVRLLDRFVADNYET